MEEPTGVVKAEESTTGTPEHPMVVSRRDEMPSRQSEEMITFLRMENEDDTEDVITLYQQGLRMQVPPSDSSREGIRERLWKQKTLIHKTDGKVDGLVSYTEPVVSADTEYRHEIVVEFICAAEPGQGVGTKLMGRLAGHARAIGINWIATSVSTWDIRAMEFYEMLGFVEDYRKIEDVIDGRPFYLSMVSADAAQVQVNVRQQDDRQFEREIERRAKLFARGDVVQGRITRTDHPTTGDYVFHRSGEFSAEVGVDSNAHLIDDLLLVGGRQLPEEEVLNEDLLSEETGSEFSTRLYLTPERHQEIIRESLVEVLESFGRFCDSDVLSYLFPGIDLRYIKEYDFSRSRIRFFIVSQQDYKRFDSDEEYSEESKEEPGAISYIMYLRDTGEDAAFYELVTMSEEAVILVDESGLFRTYLEEIRGGSELPETITDEERGLLELTLKSMINHETLHQIWYRGDIPNEIYEGYTEFRSQILARGSERFRMQDDLLDAAYLSGYPYETTSFAILAELLIVDGLSIEDLDRAFFLGDPTSITKITNSLDSRFGRGTASRIVNMEFEGKEEFLEFMVGIAVGRNIPESGPSDKSKTWGHTKHKNFVHQLSAIVRRAVKIYSRGEVPKDGDTLLYRDKLRILRRVDDLLSVLTVRPSEGPRLNRLIRRFLQKPTTPSSPPAPR